MIEQLIARVFATRNAAKLLHWRGPSYPHHKTLDKFIDQAGDALDDVVECWQGCHGAIDFGQVPSYARPAPEAVLAHIEAEMRWITSAREQISDDPAILSLVDVLSTVYQRTVYLLRFQK